MKWFRHTVPVEFDQSKSPTTVFRTPLHSVLVIDMIQNLPNEALPCSPGWQWFTEHVRLIFAGLNVVCPPLIAGTALSHEVVRTGVRFLRQL